MSKQPKKPHVVFMGVSGCGKSSLGWAVTQRLRMPLIEGDDFHSDSNRRKMSQGIALNDADRAGWLTELGGQLSRAEQPVGLTCSALKRSYREQLRQAAPGLCFVFLDLTLDQARERVKARSAHFFNPALVDSQFATLERPGGEAHVLRLDASHALDAMCDSVVAWLGSMRASASGGASP